MRYALFFSSPQDHELTSIAKAWLGRDAYTGQQIAHQTHGSLSAQRLAELTSAPGKYGFHGTLKAPFYLADGKSETQLLEAIAEFSSNTAPFQMPALKVGRLGPFFALIPDGDISALNRFTGEVVKTFEPFRAPLSEADYQRRRPENLSTRQRQYLRKWGYPYIFDDFRFHMTLTGPVPDTDADEVERVLQNLFATALNDPLFCQGLTLFVERETGEPFLINTASQSTPTKAQEAQSIAP